MLITFMLLDTHYPAPVIVSVTLLSIGSMLAVPPHELDTSPEGVIACVAAMLALAAKQVPLAPALLWHVWQTKHAKR
jgi:hypothetical protein